MSDDNNFTIAKRLYWRWRIQSLLAISGTERNTKLPDLVNAAKAETIFAPLMPDFEKLAKCPAPAPEAEVVGLLQTALNIVGAQPTSEIDDVARLQIREALHQELKRLPYVKHTPKVLGFILLLFLGGTFLGVYKFNGLIETANEARTEINSAVTDTQKSRDSVAAIVDQSNKLESRQQEILVDQSRKLDSGIQQNYAAALQKSQGDAAKILVGMRSTQGNFGRLAGDMQATLKTFNKNEIQAAAGKANRLYSEVEDVDFIVKWSNGLRAIGTRLHLGENLALLVVLLMTLLYAMLRCGEVFSRFLLRKLFYRT